MLATKIYLEFKCDTQYFVQLCKAAKAAKMSIPQVINLLKIANNNLPSAQHRCEILQKQNNTLESVLRTAAKEFQNLSNDTTYMRKRLDTLKSEYENESTLLHYLRQQAAKLEAFVNHFKNDDQEYIKLRKTIEEEVLRILSDKKALLKLAVLSIGESISIYQDSMIFRISSYSSLLISPFANLILSK